MKRITAILLAVMTAFAVTSCNDTNVKSYVPTDVPSESVTSSDTESPVASEHANVSSPAENTTAMTQSVPVSVPESKPESEPASVPETDSSPSEPPAASEPVFIENTHDWDNENNALYNINYAHLNSLRRNSEFAIDDTPAELWQDLSGIAPLNETYDPETAAEFSKEHWSDGIGLCAPYVTRCLHAGGLSIGSDSSTALCLMLLNSKLGFGQFLTSNDDGTVTLPDYAAPGDVVQIYCSYEGLMNHSLMYVGNDGDGHMRACCHNSANSGESAFIVRNICYSCGMPQKEVFFYHFYRENDKNLPDVGQDCMAWEPAGYIIEGESYDADPAIEYVKNNPYDGIGMLGALQTETALAESGLKSGSSCQTAFFMQLLKSRTGTMYTISINPDRTVTLPEFISEGDICFVYCPKEMLVCSSFLIKGTDADGKMIAYSCDDINDDTKPFLIESICPSEICDSEMSRVAIYHFGKGT